jgi:3-deoxy-D-manno-octulosonic-acid transferase
MRHFYTLLFYLLTPLIPLRLLWRSRNAPDYRRRWQERFGFIPQLPHSGCIWIHAVSLGETRAALPLIRALRERYRHVPILVTTMTPTGSQQVRESLGSSVQHVYLPYDLPGPVHRFLARTRPRLAIIMETELWPNLFHACRHANIPLLLANARLSEHSAHRYGWIAGLIRPTLRCVNLVAAQSQADAAHFQALGVTEEQLRVTGNIKYDLTLPSGLEQQGQELRKTMFGRRPVWIAASTHKGEDEQILDAFEQLYRNMPELLLVLVPRHPERFEEVAELCRQRDLNLVMRSAQQPCQAQTQVFLGDSMGELLLLYAASDVVFVGGSLIRRGGHNILEPALLGLPVMFGPHMFNFSEACEQLLRNNAAWQVSNTQELVATVTQLLANGTLRKSAGRRGKAAVEANRGALAKLFSLVESLIQAEKRARNQLKLNDRHIGKGQTDSEQRRLP